MNSRDLQACSDAIRDAEAKIQTILADLVGTPDRLTGNAVSDNGPVVVCPATAN